MLKSGFFLWNFMKVLVRKWKKNLVIAQNWVLKTIYYQSEALGTGHAIMCAKESLSGPAVIATPIQHCADFDLYKEADSVMGKTSRPTKAFGVVKLNANNEIVELVEKTSDFFQI
jgi:glucose-1-phosphate thymidylyltransferase